MKSSSLCIFSGLLFILFGFGDDSSKLIPAWLKFFTGGILLSIGIYFYYKLDKKIFKKSISTKFSVKDISSKFYIILGILFLRMDRFVDYVDQDMQLRTAFMVFGGLLCIFGLMKHFKKKKDKKESGNIE